MGSEMRLGWTWLVVGSLCIAACGGPSSSSSTDGGRESGSLRTPDGSSKSDSGSSGSGSGSIRGSGSGSGSGTSGSSGTTGSIFISQLLSGENAKAPELLASAEFSNGSQSDNCVKTMQVGSCLGYVCTPVVDAGAPYESAGTLSLAGGKLASPLDFATSDEATYALDDTHLDVSAGQTLTVTASGGTVPAFTQSIVAPAGIDLTKPNVGSGTGSTSTSADLVVAWSGGQSGDTVLFEGLSGGSAYYFACTWDATVGTGTVPKAILAELAGQQSAEIEWLEGTTKTFDAGGYAITLTAYVGGAESVTFE